MAGEGKKLSYYVNGEYRISDTKKYTDVFDPSTGEVTAQVPCCTKEEIEEAIDAAKTAYPGSAGAFRTRPAHRLGRLSVSTP